MAKDAPHARDLRRGRFSEGGRTYLVTTVADRRRPVFAGLQSARIVVRSLVAMERSQRAQTLCYVLMPDHLHWLLVLGEGQNLSRVVQSMKSYSARQINGLRRACDPVWQAGFHDHALRRDEDLRRTARYLVANPVRAGLVATIGDWPHWDAKWL
jgi:putative transposase